MVASVTARCPTTISDHFDLEWQYQGALARSKETILDTDKLYDINKEYNEYIKSGRIRSSDSKTFEDLMKRLETWSKVDGTRSTAASKMLTPEFIRNHSGLANNRILKDRMKIEEKKNKSEAKEKETPGEKTHRERSTSPKSRSSRR
ncbi:hypothetical protein BHYA_0005g01140 [Botrytis hyacinthi]|uniref:Uncharacterized protein n=1 Tax=Botrytis hyacinthi TaxID=278943 RepID=A0A4Z1H1W4_9HELO|nr:hypothetical protein BHYA_0005g01140 [Botrytis hyacinthi]